MSENIQKCIVKYNLSRLGYFICQRLIISYHIQFIIECSNYHSMQFTVAEIYENENSCTYLEIAGVYCVKKQIFEYDL